MDFGRFQNKSSTSESSQLLFQCNGLDSTTQHNLKINVLDSGTYSIDFLSLDGVSTNAPSSVSDTTTTSSSASSSTKPSPKMAMKSLNPVSEASSSGFVTRVASSSTVQITSVPIVNTVTDTESGVLRTTVSSSSTPMTSILGAFPPSTSQEMANPVESQGNVPLGPDLRSSGHVAMIAGVVVGLLVFVGVLAGILLYLHYRRGPLFDGRVLRRRMLNLRDWLKPKPAATIINPFLSPAEMEFNRVASRNIRVIDITERATIMSNTAIRASSSITNGDTAQIEKLRLRNTLEASDASNPESTSDDALGDVRPLSLSDARDSLESMDPPSYETLEN